MPNFTTGDPGEQLRRVQFIAHDLNHLAAIILGYSSMLLERVPDSGSRRRDLEQIRLAAERIASLSAQLQDWRIEHPTPPSLVDLSGLVRETETLLQGVVGPEIELTTELSSSLAPTRAVPEQIDRVFLNLAINALDAMPKGGKLTIATENLALDAAAASEWDVPAGSYVEVRFTDDGPGIDADAIRKEGLGLPIVREIAQQAGGGILIRSVPERGATISMVLPRAADPVASAEGTAPAILVVDDEAPIRALAGAMLEAGGYRVLTADNGEQAMVTLARGGVRLMLVDILMPQKDGLEVIRLARKKYPGLRIIAMSGGRDDYLAVAKLLGADAVLGKPFTKDLLLETVRSFIE
jgi:CheY-like chemotaxis protein